MNRLTSLDIAKGIAIILVIVFHASQGLIASGIEPPSFGESWAEAFAYGFHVQIFFLLIGYFSYHRASDVGYQVDRFASLYYPYLLWLALTVVLTAVLPGANSRHDLHDLLTIPFVPLYHFWFLLASIVSTLLLFVIRGKAALLLGVAAALAIAASGMDWNQSAYFFIFTAIGALLRMHNWQPRASLLLGIAGGSLLLAVAYFAVDRGFSIKAPGLFLVSLAGCYMLFVLSERLAASAAGPWLAYAGERSLVIYLTHGFFATLARIVAGRLIPHDYWGLIWASIAIAGVLGPLVLDQVASRLGLGLVLGFRPVRIWPRSDAAASARA